MLVLAGSADLLNRMIPGPRVLVIQEGGYHRMTFGNRKGGTAAVAAAPLAANDLPLQLLVWDDDEGAV